MKFDNWLDRVLHSRELRQKKQWELIDDYKTTVLSLTINMPGRVKLSADSKYIFEVALQEIDAFGLVILEKFIECKETGCEAQLVIQENALSLKKLTCSLEESHPLGRFMDIDVIDAHKTILSRKDLNQTPRKCYMCDLPAKECARSQKHSSDELQAHIHNTVIAYQHEL